MRKTISFLLLPSLILVGVFVLYPLFFVFVLSLTKWPLGGVPNLCGLCQYFDLGSTPLFWTVLFNSLVLFLTIPLAILLGLAFALLIHAKPYGHYILAPLITAGMVIPPAVVGIAWILSLDPRVGAYNALLSYFGIPPRAYMYDPQIQIYTLMFVASWAWVGFTFITFLANLESIPRELYEAGQVDGATKFTMFKSITLPMLRPAFLINFIMTTLYVLKLFDIIYILGAEAPPTKIMNLAYYVYYLLQYRFELGGPAAAAALLTIITIAVSYYFIRRSVRL